MKKGAAKKGPTRVETIRHGEAKRLHIPTAETKAVVSEEHLRPLRAEFERRDPDSDPQLVWRGKDLADWSEIVVNAPPLFVQEKVQPKTILDDLLRHGRESEPTPERPLLFDDFNGIPPGAARTEFYRHQAHWSNRMILGDSLQVMASLAEREGLRRKVQCIYLDPPYGIKFNSNFQWSTTSREVKDGKKDHLTREPEQVKAFRDTWRDGIHSYLTYLRDRLIVARDLLTESGSVFVQIGDENVHRVRSVLDEVFGPDNCISQISFTKTTGFSSKTLSNTVDYLLWYAKDAERIKYREVLRKKVVGEPGATAYRPAAQLDSSVVGPARTRLATSDQLTAQGEAAEPESQRVVYRDREFLPSSGLHWKTTADGVGRLNRCARVFLVGNTLRYLRFLDDYPVVPYSNHWSDTGIAGFTANKIYVVQTLAKVVERCVLMTTDPGDLVLDPTCGSGTTAYVAEQWGRRWITVDTSRVALALARARIMGAKYPWYLLADSPEGQAKEAEIEKTPPKTTPTHGRLRQGFVYERVPHVTLRAIANNAEIDVLWERYRKRMEPVRADLNEELNESWEEWEIPREAAEDWSDPARQRHRDWWELRLARQREMDASIAAGADSEVLYDRPYEDPQVVRVAGPFTVESITPHRAVPTVEEEEPGETLLRVAEETATYRGNAAFETVVEENLRIAGVHQVADSRPKSAEKRRRRGPKGRIRFHALGPGPTPRLPLEGRYREGNREKRAAIHIGPEFGVVTRADLVAAARDAAEQGCEVLVTCAFAYEPNAADEEPIGRMPVLRARINTDLHMAPELRSKKSDALFVVFGEPDIELHPEDDGRWRVKLLGVDVYDPNTGRVRSDNADGIACWLLDTEYDEESFRVRHAYFPGTKNDPYAALRKSLRAEISSEAWETLRSDRSRPFPEPATGRIAVKVINHLGDEVLKVLRVPPV